MTQDAWPSPDAPSGPLPRIDDLPIAEQGYDQESVRLAFDSFYRHAAQLDASLRALEAVEVFRRDADALRNDLRALRELGLGGMPEPAWPSLRYEAPPREVPVVVFRLAFEAALIVAVAVIAGVAHFRAVVVVALMAAAFVVVAISEWLGARSRFVSPAAGFAPSLQEAEPAPYAEAPAPVWAAPEPGDIAPSDDTEAEGLTIVPAGPQAVEAQPEGDEEPDAPEPAASETPAGEEAEPVAAPETDAPGPATETPAQEESEAEAEPVAEPEPVAEEPAEPEAAAAEEEPAEPVAQPGAEPVAEEPAEPEAAADEEEPADDADEDEEEDDEARVDPWEQHVVVDDGEDEEPALVQRGFFRRRRR